MQSMTPAYAAYPTTAYNYADPATREESPLERPPSLARKTVEVLLYLSILNTALTYVTGAWQVPYLGGGVIMLAATICFTIMSAQREKLPASIWFMFAMNVGATLSQGFHGEMPVVGEGLNSLFLSMCQILMVSYLVRNSATQKRVLFLMSVGIVVTVVLLGEQYGHGQFSRLRVEKTQNIGGLGNANELGLQGGLFALSLLFWSLRSAKTIRPILWFMALVLLMFVLLSVSRGGILAAFFGLAMLTVTILFGKGVRVGGIVMVLFGFLVASQAAFLIAGAWSAIERRMGEHSVRTEVYRWETVRDLADTAVLGRGVAGSFTVAGIHAHNVFIYLHLAFGGITAWPFLLWVVFLGVRTLRLLFRRDVRLDIRMEVLCYFSIFFLHNALSNMGFTSISCIYAIAMIERYSARPDARTLITA